MSTGLTGVELMVGGGLEGGNAFEDMTGEVVLMVSGSDGVHGNGR